MFQVQGTDYTSDSLYLAVKVADDEWLNGNTRARVTSQVDGIELVEYDPAQALQAFKEVYVD